MLAMRRRALSLLTAFLFVFGLLAVRLFANRYNPNYDHPSYSVS